MSAGCEDLSRLSVYGLMVPAALCARPTQAAAEVRIRNSGGGRLEIEARDANVRDVLEALRASHMLQFRPSKELPRVVTGTYSGTLSQVLSCILVGYNYFSR